MVKIVLVPEYVLKNLDIHLWEHLYLNAFNIICIV